MPPDPVAGVHGSAFRGGIDAVAQWPVRSAEFVITGWCLHPQGVPVTAVRARIRGRTFPGVYGVPRPEVAPFGEKALGSDRCGYQIPVVAPTAATCEVEAQLAHGAWHTVQSFVVEGPRSAICGALDSVPQGPARSPEFVIAGWCVHAEGIPVTAVRARIGGRTFHGVYGVSRPDVAAFWGEAFEPNRCGYQIPVVAPTPATCEVDVELADGAWQTVHSFVVEAPGSAFAGAVDALDLGPGRTTRFVVSGWCVHAEGILVTAVRARIGGRTFPGVYGVQRPDVAAFWGDLLGPERCGYQIPVVAPAAATCDVDAQLAYDTWQTVYSFALDPPRRRAWPERLKWGRFWWHCWLGRPQVWTDLSETERDFAVLCVQRRGWLNLDVTPQYAPRPLIPERFPRSRLPVERLPRIAAVTPSFQQASFLEHTMCSVLDQPGVRIDYVVQDGGSTDGSVEVIRRHASRLRHWESAPDGGQASAIIRGFSRVEVGPDDLMMYLNSDDILIEGAARFVAEYFARHPEVDVVYGHRILIDEDGHEVGRWITPRRVCDDLRAIDWIPQETVFWRKRVWDRVGGIDVSFRFALDWDLLLRFDAAGACIARLPWFLGGFRLHSQQKTHARLQDDGLPEMNRLRQRTFGRMPTQDELHLASRRSQVDSALVYALLQHGWRV